jgi:hypothetical protein
MSQHRSEWDDVPMWTDLPVTGDLVTDIKSHLQAEMMSCGPCGCAADAADPLLERALKEIKALRKQLTARPRQQASN